MFMRTSHHFLILFFLSSFSINAAQAVKPKKPVTEQKSQEVLRKRLTEAVIEAQEQNRFHLAILAIRMYRLNEGNEKYSKRLVTTIIPKNHFQKRLEEFYFSDTQSLTVQAKDNL